MSDTDLAYDLDQPALPDFSATDFISQRRRRIVGDAVSTPLDDVEPAARSYQLGRATGAKPALVYNDVENFESQHRASLNGGILNNNAWLREFIDADPMRAKLSADDWGNLDAFTSGLEKARRYTGFPTRVAGAGVDAGIKGFQEGFGHGSIGEWVTTVPFLKDNKASQAIWAAAGSPIEAIFRTLGAGIHGATEATRAMVVEATGDERLARDLAGMVENQLTGVGVHAPAKPTPKTVAEGNLAKFETSEKYRREAKEAYELDPEKFQAELERQDWYQAISRAKAWIDSNLEPPAGLHSKIDQIKEKTNETDLKGLEETTRLAEASATRERDPQTIAELVRQRDRGSIQIDGEAVARLYGERTPGVEDGLLGWVPGIEAQLELARHSGSDITIPLSEWYARGDSDLFKLLRDDIRTRPGNITKNEGLRRRGADDAEIQAGRDEVAAEMAQQANEAMATGEAGAKEQARAQVRPEGEAAATTDPVVAEFLKDHAKREIIADDLPSVRAAGGLEPLFAVGDRKVTLKRAKSEQNYTGDVQFHDFEILNEHGKPVGAINLSLQKGGKQLYVEMIQAGTKANRYYDPNFLGPSLVRDLLRQLKKEFPEAETITGHRVSGAREKADSYLEAHASPVVKLSVDDFSQTQAFRDMLSPYWKEYVPGIEALIKPNEAWSGKERAIGDAIKEEVRRLLPDVDIEVVHAIHREGSRTGRVEGLYLNERFTGALPKILVSLDGVGGLDVARHEAIHHLRGTGLFTPTEWASLERAAREQGWIKKYNINERYNYLGNSAKLEEAIAEGYRHWKAGEVILKDTGVFQKIADFFEALRRRIKEIIGRDFTWEELFQEVDTGRVGRREPGERREFDPKAMEPEVPPERPDLFRTPATIGMNARQKALYERRLREQHEADVAWSEARAAKEAKRELTAEYRQEKKNVTAEVEADFDARPDVAVDLYFARGELYGEKVEKLRIDREDVKAMGLDPAGLPKEYLAKEGQAKVELEDIASLTGYPNAKAMLIDLAKYNDAKRTANMSAKAFRNRLAEIEVERRMKERFGDLEENIRDRALDQVAGETELNRISEEVLALGVRGGMEAPIKKAELRAEIEDRFDTFPLQAAKSESYLNASFKKGLAAEIGLLKEDFAEAFRQKQGQFVAMVQMKLAREVEKEQKSLAKLAKRLTKREVKGLDIDAQDQIQSLLWQAGIEGRRSPLEIQRSQQMRGAGSLESYLTSLQNDGYVPDVAQWIRDGQMKPISDMSVGEFKDFSSAIKSLNVIGRETEKLTIEGQKRDFAAFRKEVVDNITSLPLRERSSQEKGSIAHKIFGADAELTRVEVVLKDLDLGEEMGPLVNTMIRPMAEAKHEEYGMQEKLAKDIKALPSTKEWRRSLDEVLPNNFLMDPSTGQPFKLTRSDLLNIMLNLGNRGNEKKFVQAYGSARPGKRATDVEMQVFRDQLQTFLDTNARKEDWDFVQGVWDIYKGFQAGMDKVWGLTSGTQPKLVEARPIVTPHGNYPGGYYPLIRDWYLSGQPETARNKDLFGPNYPNYNTPQGHLQERTAASYYIDFRQNHGMIPIRMQQVIHDIAYREAVMNAQRVIKDKEIMAAIRQHYGVEYEKQLTPWLERVAHGATMDEKNLKLRDSILRQTRLNLINYALPFNYVVTLTPDVGAANPKVLSDFYANREANMALANKWSKEIPHAIYNMDRDFREAMQKATAEGKLDTTKMKVAQWGYGIVSTVSKEFRAATWIDKFNKAQAEGHDPAKAAAIADSYVRERHGSAALADLPAIMAGGEAGRLLTMFYGYWNTQYNWLRTVKGDVSRGEYMKALETAYGTIIIGSIFGALIANPAKEEDSMAKRFAKAVPLQVLGMLPYGVREMTTMMMEGIPPNTPLGSVVKSVAASASDLKKVLTRQPVEKGVRHTAATLGLLFGIPGTLQAGRTGQGLYDVAKGKQRPRDIMEWGRLLATGEARLKRSGER